MPCPRVGRRAPNSAELRPDSPFQLGITTPGRRPHLPCFREPTLTPVPTPMGMAGRISSNMLLLPLLLILPPSLRSRCSSLMSLASITSRFVTGPIRLLATLRLLLRLQSTSLIGTPTPSNWIPQREKSTPGVPPPRWMVRLVANCGSRSPLTSPSSGRDLFPIVTQFYSRGFLCLGVQFFQGKADAHDVGCLALSPVAVGHGDEGAVGKNFNAGVGCVVALFIVHDADDVLAGSAFFEIAPGSDPTGPVAGVWHGAGHFSGSHHLVAGGNAAEGNEEPPIGSVFSGVPVAGK